MCGSPLTSKQAALRRLRDADRGGMRISVGVEARTRPLPHAIDAGKRHESLLGAEAGGGGV